MGIIGSLKEQLALLVLPVVVGEGWAAVPDKFKPEFCVILGTCETVLRELAKTTATEIDDAAVDSVYLNAHKWAAEQGFTTLMAQLDQFVKVGK